MLKIACGYTIPITKYGLPPSIENNNKAMEEITNAGFSAIEMELVAGEQEYIDKWNSVIEKSRELNLDVVSIMAVTYEMFSLDAENQEDSLIHFTKICDMTRDIGAKMVTNCFYLPPELKSEDKTQLYHGGPPVSISIPDGFTWQTLREVVVHQIRKCAEIAGQRGLDFAMELRAGDFISSVDGIINILDECAADNAGVIFDTAHIHAVKEYLELAILKFGKYIKLVHLSDNDGTQAYHYAPGKGNINFSVIINRLKKIGYDGYVVVDISGIENVLSEAVKMKSMLENLING